MPLAIVRALRGACHVRARWTRSSSLGRHDGGRARPTVVGEAGEFDTATTVKAASAGLEPAASRARPGQDRTRTILPTRAGAGRNSCAAAGLVERCRRRSGRRSSRSTLPPGSSTSRTRFASQLPYAGVGRVARMRSTFTFARAATVLDVVGERTSGTQLRPPSRTTATAAIGCTRLVMPNSWHVLSTWHVAGPDARQRAVKPSGKSGVERRSTDHLNVADPLEQLVTTTV